MVKYTNFYETVKEADMRLRHTLVMYDGEPYYVLLISDHKKDGVFRIYMDKAGNEHGFAFQREQVPYEASSSWNVTATVMDDWLEKNPDKGVIRKMMNSPKFNQFKPFPLGMMNKDGFAVYVERRPLRHTQQGLMDNMMKCTQLSAGPVYKLVHPPGVTNFDLYNTVMGNYPTAKECVHELTDPNCINTGAAFHREFAFIKGPVDTLFLAYKEDLIGVIPNGDLSAISLAKPFKHTKEVVESLHIFDSINL